MKLENIFDKYQLLTRVFPLLLLILPPFIWFVFLFPSLVTIRSSTIATGIILILLFSASNTLRKHANVLQEKLIKKWDALPATLILMHENNYLNKNTKKRYHDKLISLGLEIPSHKEEKNNRFEAIEKYNSCIDHLRKKTRDQNNYNLVLSENIYYGFHRNLLSIKNFGLWLSIISLLLGSITFVLLRNGDSTLEFHQFALPFLINSLLLIFWKFYINTGTVFNAGLKYAERLLEYLE